MKFHLLAAGAILIAASACNAKNEVKVTYADGLAHPDTLYVEYSLIENQIKATKPEDLNLKYDTVVWKNGEFRFSIDQAGPAEYSFRISDVPTSESMFSMYTQPGENISINFTSLSPVNYTAKGSALMEGLAELQSKTAPVYKAYGELMNSDNADVDKIQALASKFESVQSDFIKQNPKSPAAVYALLQLSQSDSYGELYNSLTPEAKKSILFPFAEQQYKRFEAQQEADAKVKKMGDGTTPAPAFTLPNLSGKKVSLADFRGKWVVLDFWGSWCRWCIKGFPELKEAYAKYKSQGLEVIGIDCGDSDADWRAAVKQYELPWIQLYNGDNKELTAEYAIQGFPTKIIVNPEGIIVNVTVGEDPEFFTALDGFMKK